MSLATESKPSKEVARERQRAEEAQAHLAAIVNSSDDAIISKSLTGVIQSWNRGAEKIFGYSAAEAVGQHITLIIPPERRGEEDEVLAKLRRGEVIDHFETVRRAKDGRLLDISITVSPIRDGAGRIIGASKVARDITERRRSDEAQARLAAIIASSDDAIVSKSLAGVIQSWNRGAEKIFGYSAAEAIGQHITLIIPEERRGEEDEVLAKLRRGELIDHFETVRRAKDGRLLDISITVSPVRDGAGRIIGASKVARDITEKKRVEQALRESEERLRTLVEQLKDTDRRKDEFIAMLAHELRNPLAAIGLGVELLNRAPLVDSKARIAVPAIARQTRQLQRLAEDMLDVARVTHGKLKLQKQPLDVLELAKSVAADFAGRRKEAAITAVGAEAWVDGDPARIQQMLGNLIDNAVKFGGRNIAISVACEGNCARVEVRDDGQGIAAELLPTLFQPFVQGEQAFDRERGGLGLGLALVDRLAALHGGRIEAASEGLGKGSRFTLWLPAAPRPASAGAASTAAAGRRRVLVIEDEEDARECLRVLLESDGHEVSLAQNGAEGLERFVSFQPDVALVDVGLPGIDGYELARRARSLAGGKQARLVAITGYGDEKSRERARRAGFDLHVTKPVSYEQLVQVLS